MSMPKRSEVKTLTANASYDNVPKKNKTTWIVYGTVPKRNIILAWPQPKRVSKWGDIKATVKAIWKQFETILKQF